MFAAYISKENGPEGDLELLRLVSEGPDFLTIAKVKLTSLLHTGGKQNIYNFHVLSRLALAMFAAHRIIFFLELPRLFVEYK